LLLSLYILNYRKNRVILYTAFRVCLVRMHAHSAGISSCVWNDHHHCEIMIPISPAEAHKPYVRGAVHICNSYENTFFHCGLERSDYSRRLGNKPSCDFTFSLLLSPFYLHLHLHPLSCVVSDPRLMTGNGCVMLGVLFLDLSRSLTIATNACYIARDIGRAFAI
jgi:hypothetical protein